MPIPRPLRYVSIGILFSTSSYPENWSDSLEVRQQFDPLALYTPRRAGGRRTLSILEQEFLSIVAEGIW